MHIHSIRNKALILLAALALVGVGGCSHADAPLPPGMEEPDLPNPDKLTLCLNVSFDNNTPATRAGNKPDCYDDPSGNFEKISTLRVIIVRQLSNDKNSGIVEANRLVMTNDQGHPMYDNLEFKVIANELKRIYLIANEQYLTAPTGFETPSKFLDSFRAVKKNEEGEPTELSSLNNWTVSVPGLTPDMTEIKGYSNGLFSPSPSVENPRRLPLTEFFDLELNRDENDPDDTFYSHLFMTRAAAKAMFYLNASENFTGDVSSTYIKAISLNGVGSTEYVFPHDATYSPSKDDLISVSSTDLSATLKQAYITDFNAPTDNRKLTYIIDGLNIKIEKPVNGLRQITELPIYFPESILEPEHHYIVGVQLNNGMWLSAPLQPQFNDNGVQINKYNILNIKREGVTHEAISRNTFLPIELYFDEAMDLTVHVLPWDREEYYVDYTANVGFNEGDFLDFEGKEQQGQTGDFLSLNTSTGQLVLNYGKVAKGSFCISSPVGATWDAYLVTTGGIQDAIQFQMPNPDYDPANTSSTQPATINTTHISGNIGEPANFGIVATLAPGATQNSATLMVIVTLADGTPVIANVVGDWPCSKGDKPINRLTVIENPL